MCICFVLLIGVSIVFRMSVKKMVKRCATVLVIILPFLYWTRTAIYDGKPAIGDTAIGFPLIYAYGQSDAGLGPFYTWKLVVDVSLGLACAITMLWLVNRRRRKIAKDAPTHRSSVTLANGS